MPEEEKVAIPFHDNSCIYVSKKEFQKKLKKPDQI